MLLGYLEKEITENANNDWITNLSDANFWFVARVKFWYTRLAVMILSFWSQQPEQWEQKSNWCQCIVIILWDKQLKSHYSLGTMLAEISVQIIDALLILNW